MSEAQRSEELDELRRRLAAAEEQCAEQRQALAALLSGAEKYRILLDESSDPIFAFEPDGRYHYANRAFADGVGRRPEEIIGRTIWDIFAKDEADRRFAMVRSVFDSGETGVIEVRVPRADGDRYYVTTLKPVLDALGKVASVICISKEITERKRTEDRLRESEQRFRSFVESLNDVLFTLTADGVFSYVSPQWTAAFGYQLDETIGKPFPPFVHPDDIAGCFAFMQRVFATGEKQSGIEYRVLCKDGRYLWYTANASLIRDAVSGMPILVGIGRDITERKHLEEKLRFRQFGLDHADEIVAWIDHDARILDANETACRTLGYTHAELLQLTAADLEPNFAFDAWARHWQELKSRKSLRFESSLRRRDGSLLPTEVVSNYFEYDGVEHCCALVRDISWRQQAEEGMQLARQIFDTASEAIFVSDLKGNLLDVNAEACRLAKYSREQMLRLRNVDIVAQEEVSRIAPELEQCDAGVVVENRWLLLCADGSTVPLDLVVQRLPGDRYLAIGRDLTEREKAIRQVAEARDAAEAASRAKSRFLAAASHDLRQPIQAINLFHDALRKTGLTAEQQRLSDSLFLSAKSLGGILDALLDISRLDAGAIAARPETVPAEALFHAIEAEFAPLAAEKSLRFMFHFSHREMALFTDPKLLISLLANLIGNAIKYTEQGGILVGVRRRGGEALIQVWDTGIGIAPEYTESIFEEYVQIDNPERDRAKGLGLGLAIVRRLARLLGSEVRVRSVPGRGSVFELRLALANAPAGDASPQPEQDTPPAATVAPAPERRVVLVEDNEMVAEAIELSLTSIGMRVETYLNAEEALSKPDITAADVFISDFSLPGLNGVQFLDAVQQRSARPIKAIVLTGDTSSKSREITQASGWTVLFKPVRLPVLVSAIEALESAP